MKAAGLILLIGCAGTAIVGAEDGGKALSEKIVDVSPEGKFGMRLRFDRKLNDQMIANESNPRPGNHGLHSHAIEEIDLVATATGEVLAKLMDEDELGTFFNGVSLMWSSDSKWFAYSYGHPRFSYTTVYRFDGKRFRVMADTNKLLAEHKIDVRHEYLEPIQWSKPGLLVLRQQTIGREGADGADGLDCKLTRQISASGAVKLLSKKCYDDIDEAEKEFDKLKPRGEP